MTPAAAALLGLLRSPGSPLPATAQEADAEIFGLAMLHGLWPMLHRGRGPQLEAMARDRCSELQAERRTVALNNLRNYGEFRRIAEGLEDQGIPVMPLKGLHLAELVYRDISLRPMGDMDILVPRDRVNDALRILQALGYGFDVDLSAAVGASLDVKCNIGVEHRATGIWLEVHWSLAEPPERFAGVVASIWASATAARVGDARTLAMSPELLLLHVCGHLAYGHAFGFSLRALCDIAEIVGRHPDLRWQDVIGEAGSCGWGRGLAAALRLAKDHLAAAVPESVLRELGADKLDETLLAEAMQHLVSFVEIPAAVQFAPNLIAATSTKGTLRMLALASRRVFLPRAELGLLYGLPRTSWRLPCYYAIRATDLFRRYARDAWELRFTNPGLAAAAKRHLRLANWIKEA